MKSTIKKNAAKVLKKKQPKQLNNEVDFDSLALPGPPLTDDQFRKMILSIENGPSMSLEEFKARWARMERKILKLVK